MKCKHKFKIHETYFKPVQNTGANIEQRAICVCEKCALVVDRKIQFTNPN